MFSNLGAEMAYDMQIVHFVCVLVHRSCKGGLDSTKVLSKYSCTSFSAPCIPSFLNESPLQVLQHANCEFCMRVGP